MAEIKVFGHTPPDTDSTCSPIVYAWYLKEIKGLDATAYIKGQPNKEALYLLERFGFAVPAQLAQLQPSDQVILIDSNNPEELPEEIDGAEILEIIDHHKLSGMHTASPLKITIRPYGSVPTVMWEIIGDTYNKIPANIAGLMLGGILSDTLNLTSTTTTDIDKEVAAQLEKIAGVDKDELASAMFAAKSNLDGMSARDIVLSDHKNFEFGGRTYKVAVLETTDPTQALNRLAEIKAEIPQIIAAQNLAGLFFFVVDILKLEAQLIATGNSDLDSKLEQAFKAKFVDGLMHLPGVVSRKKQMVPALEEVLS